MGGAAGLRVLWNGLRGCCPRCGEEKVVGRWLRVVARCPKCDLQIVEDEGDPWAFIVVLDRAFILLLIVLIYFQWAPTEPWAVATLLVAITGIFVATTRYRFGVCLALAYLMRRWWESRPEV